MTDDCDIKITVTGMGQTIWHQMNLIEQALKAAGYNVTVVDAHPMTEWPYGNKSSAVQIRTTKIELHAEHLPWGG